MHQHRHKGGIATDGYQMALIAELPIGTSGCNKGPRPRKGEARLAVVIMRELQGRRPGPVVVDLRLHLTAGHGIDRITHEKGATGRNEALPITVRQYPGRVYLWTGQLSYPQISDSF